MARILISISALVLLAVVHHSAGLDTDNAISTAKIIAKSCYVPGVRSEETVKKFMECYDDVPGKEHFMKCQRETFEGRLFDSISNFRQNCKSPQKIPAYGRCIQQEFDNAGQDMDVSVRQLNACQLPLFSCSLTGK